MQHELNRDPIPYSDISVRISQKLILHPVYVLKRHLLPQIISAVRLEMSHRIRYHVVSEFLYRVLLKQ